MRMGDGPVLSGRREGGRGSLEVRGRAVILNLFFLEELEGEANGVVIVVVGGGLGGEIHRSGLRIMRDRG
jgi:hypothetical protein